MLGMGSNLFGQLGYSEKYKTIEFPSQIPLKEMIVEISCGGEHSMALSNKGEVFSWGLNLKG